MSTYVYSLRGSARLAHIGDATGTACGLVFMSAFVVSDNAPADRAICTRCATVTGTPARVTALQGDRLAARDATLVTLLRDGLSDRAVARRLRLTPRTLSRYVHDAMRRIGARTRFEWGYLAGTARVGFRQ